MGEPIYVGRGQWEQLLLPAMANRHGLIAGATGTGKTVTLQVLAEQFSRLGVPVFAADIKGDLSGISQPGVAGDRILQRLMTLGRGPFTPSGCPVVCWDLYGQQGHPVRTTVSEMGPLLMARILGLNDVQTGVLALTFQIADDNGLLLLDLKDLQAMLRHVGEHAREYTTAYGNISAASIGAIQRGLLQLEQQGGASLLGEPALNLLDFIQTDAAGQGVINLLSADTLMQAPKLYSTFLLWLLSELFEALPEVGDVEKPRLVFFFDEAHLLFKDCPKALLDRIEQVVRLVRSKGVGIYFVTQNPLDIPDTVLGQLGNRIQHALRAYTPRDQKAVTAAAQTFRANADLNVERAIIELGVGEALVSLLDPQGVPGMADRTLICPPSSQIGPISDVQRQVLIETSAVYGYYEAAVDRESAYEILTQRAERDAARQAQELAEEAARRDAARQAAQRRTPTTRTTSTTRSETTRPRTITSRETPIEALTKSAARSIGSQVGRQLVRGLLGTLLGGRR